MSLVKGAVNVMFCVCYKHGNMQYLIFNICPFFMVTKVIFACAVHVIYQCFSFNNRKTTYFVRKNFLFSRLVGNWIDFLNLSSLRELLSQ